MRCKRGLLIAAVLIASAREASGDIYHLKSPSEVVTEKGSKLKLPPGYFLDEETWSARDAELKATQEARTRLKAENDSLRKSAVEDYPWLATGVVGAFGIVFGAVAFWAATK